MKELSQRNKKIIISIISILIATLVLLFGNNWIGRWSGSSEKDNTEKKYNASHADNHSIKDTIQNNLVYLTKRINSINFPDFAYSHDRLIIKNESNTLIKNINGSFEKGHFPESIKNMILKTNNHIEVDYSFDDTKTKFQIKDLNPDDFVTFDILVSWNRSSGQKFINKYNSIDKIRVRGEGFTGVKK